MYNLIKALIRQIWQYAKTHGYTIISKDEDFFQLANLPQEKTPYLLWVRLGSLSQSQFDSCI
jgi:predicted nuclease of predicted toxin-antitoxin system